MIRINGRGAVYGEVWYDEELPRFRSGYRPVPPKRCSDRGCPIYPVPLIGHRSF